MISSVSSVSCSTSHLPHRQRRNSRRRPPAGAARGNGETNPRARSNTEGPEHGSQHPAYQRPQGPKCNGVSRRPPPPIFSPERASRQGELRLIITLRRPKFVKRPKPGAILTRSNDK